MKVSKTHRGWWATPRTQQLVNVGAVVVWAAFIFYMSSLPELGIKPRTQLIPNLAHFIEYAVLTFLLIRALRSQGLHLAGAVRTAMILALLYAASDELHQSFVRNRVSSILDFLVDGLGSATMAIIVSVRTRSVSPGPGVARGQE